MFALAVYDIWGETQIFISPDQMGVKPLYYAMNNDAFVFASECKGLLASGLIGREVGPDGLVAYLQFGSVPAPLTIYRDARALEAGQMLRGGCGPGGPRVGAPVR